MLGTSVSAGQVGTVVNILLYVILNGNLMS